MLALAVIGGLKLAHKEPGPVGAHRVNVLVSIEQGAATTRHEGVGLAQWHGRVRGRRRKTWVVAFQRKWGEAPIQLL